MCDLKYLLLILDTIYLIFQLFFQQNHKNLQIQKIIYQKSLTNKLKSVQCFYFLQSKYIIKSII